MPHSIFGWDLPPGCRISDIPGNRPEDEVWENILENFFSEKRINEKKFGILLPKNYSSELDRLYNGEDSSLIDTLITDAIEYGIEIGTKQEKDNRNLDDGMYTQYLIDKHITPILFKTEEASNAKEEMENLIQEGK